MVVESSVRMKSSSGPGSISSHQPVPDPGSPEPVNHWPSSAPVSSLSVASMLSTKMRMSLMTGGWTVSGQVLKK